MDYYVIPWPPLAHSKYKNNDEQKNTTLTEFDLAK